jgi:hypothetical protein
MPFGRHPISTLSFLSGVEGAAAQPHWGLARAANQPRGLQIPSGHAANGLLLMPTQQVPAKMKFFRKKLKKQDEKVLAEASDLATRKLQQYFADRRNLPSVTRDAPKKPTLTRLRWW